MTAHKQTEQYFWKLLNDNSAGSEKAAIEFLDNNNPSRLAKIKNNEKKSPLHVAIEKKKNNLVKILLEQKADINARDKNGYTPVMKAIETGNKDALNTLLASGIKINQTYQNGGTDLHLAILTKQKDIAKILIAKGANIKATTKNGFTPLHLACDNGWLDLVQDFIAKGADVNASSIYGVTPLHLAAKQGDEAVVAKLIAEGASANPYCFDFAENWTPFSAVKDIQCTASIAKFTPLHFAAANGHKGVVEKLIANGADAGDKTGFTPLHFAAQNGFEEIVELLLDKGADANTTLDGKHRIFEIVDRLKWQENFFIKFLYKVYRTKIENEMGQDSILRGFSPLHAAAQLGRQDIAEKLIEKGADVNASSIMGATPLHSAAKFGHQDVVRLLIKNKADQSAKDSEGKRAIDIAVNLKHDGAVKAFLEGGEYNLEVKNVASLLSQYLLSDPELKKSYMKIIYNQKLSLDTDKDSDYQETQLVDNYAGDYQETQLVAQESSTEMLAAAA